MNHKRKLPEPLTSDIVWTYWITRNSINGEISGECTLWNARPTRVKYGQRVTWVGTNTRDPGCLGDFTPQTIDGWFRTHPDTDRECLRVETRPNQTELAEATKGQS